MKLVAGEARVKLIVKCLPRLAVFAARSGLAGAAPFRFKHQTLAMFLCVRLPRAQSCTIYVAS